MEGYKKKLRVFGIGKINVCAVTVFFVLLIIGLSVNFWGTKAEFLATGSVAGDVGLSVALVLVGVILHEGLHALAAIVFGKCKKEDIEFGVKLKEGLFYCHCKKPVDGKAYCAILIIPLIVTGIIPFIVCMITGGLMQTAIFALMTAGASGDVVMLCGVLKNKDTERKIIDHPDATAYYALYPENDLPEGFSETSEEEEKEILSSAELKDGKKLGIKILLIALFIALTALVLFLIGLFMEIV